MLEMYGVTNKSPADYADELYARVTQKCPACQVHAGRTVLAQKFLDAKLGHLNKMEKQNENVARIQEYMERHFETFVKQGGGNLRR